MNERMAIATDVQTVANGSFATLTATTNVMDVVRCAFTHGGVRFASATGATADFGFHRRRKLVVQRLPWFDQPLQRRSTNRDAARFHEPEPPVTVSSSQP